MIVIKKGKDVVELDNELDARNFLTIENYASDLSIEVKKKLAKKTTEVCQTNRQGIGLLNVDEFVQWLIEEFRFIDLKDPIHLRSRFEKEKEEKEKESYDPFYDLEEAYE